MKKQKLLVVIVSVIMLVALYVPAFATDTPVIPEQRLLPRLVDDVNLLTKEQKNTLEHRLDDISEKNKFDIAINIVDGVGFKSMMEYADDYFDYNGFGMGETRDGLVLVLSMSDRQWYVSTSGLGIDAITDKGLTVLMKPVLNKLGADEYYEAMKEFIVRTDDFVVEAKKGKPYVGRKLSSYDKTWISPLWWAIPIGLLLSASMIFYHILATKTVVKQNLAQEYVVKDSIDITKSSDRFMYNNISKTRREKSSSSSSSHTSSSGSSHGGGGGSF